MIASSTTQLRALRLVVCDVDGVLTDGTLRYGADGEADKVFHVHDGLGIRRLLDAGLQVAWITARGGAAVRLRARELGVKHLLEGRSDKAVALSDLASELGVDLAHVAYLGDDEIDVPALRAAGVGIAPADAQACARNAADLVTHARGGRGAVREVAEAILAARSSTDVAFRVVIPSRMGSTRLPGKPLRLLAGEPMIAHVWRRAISAGARDVVVACDDEAIANVIRKLGGQAELTLVEHPSGSDRIAEVVRRLGWSGDTLVVNLQGDEPGMPAQAIRKVAAVLHRAPAAGLATLATRIVDAASLLATDVVKVVLDDCGFARAFSRAPIPWNRDAFAGGVTDPLPSSTTFLRHLGIYAYRAEILAKLCALPPHPWELAESLEQLRALAAGITIAVDMLDSAPPHGVDTEADLARMEHALR